MARTVILDFDPIACATQLTEVDENGSTRTTGYAEPDGYRGAIACATLTAAMGANIRLRRRPFPRLTTGELAQARADEVARQLLCRPAAGCAALASRPG